MIEVKINGVVKWQVNEYTFNDPQMGLRSISLTVTHPSDNATVPSFIGAYVEYEGERYDIVNSKPTAEKGIDSINYKYNLIFNGQEAELQRRKIRNLATVGVDTFISQGTSFSLYADINQFKQLLENNLKYYFGNKWTINLGSTTSESVMVSVNNMFIWDLLLKTFEYYGLRWNITGNTINIGYTPDIIQHVFDYGYSGGLVKITRTAQSEPTINRLIGVGGSRNVPINYFTNRYSDFPVDPNPISGDVNIKNIMPKVFRDSVIAGTLPYIDYVEDAALVAVDGVKEDALEPNEGIYPSIAGVEVSGLGRIDQIIAASVPTANTPDDAGYSPTFDIWVKDIGFDLSDNQYTATQDAKISFTSGMLAGYEFVILATNGVRNVVVDTSKSYGGVSSKYKITLINSSEDFTATGRMLPNSVIKAMAGDSFVIYDIIMPQTYVELAELRVQNWLNEQLLVKKVEKPTYAIETTDTFFEENIAPESDGKTIREKLKSGNKLTVNNTKVTDGAQELHINNITIQYGGLLPKYSFMVTDKVSVQGSVTQRIQSSVRTVELRQSEISNKVGVVYSSSHSHQNKEVIDQLLQQHLDVLGVLSIVDGNLQIDANAYSTKELSAYGAGDGGGGGGSDYERLDTWADYDSSKAGWVLSAFLGNDLNTRVIAIDDRVTDLENSAGSGSVTSVGISVPTGLSVSNSPITSSGVIAIGLQTGYSIPTTVKQGQWDTAFGWGDHAGKYVRLAGNDNINGVKTFNDTIKLFATGTARKDVLTAGNSEWFQISYSGGYAGLDWFSKLDNGTRINTHPSLRAVSLAYASNTLQIRVGVTTGVGNESLQSNYNIWHSGDFTQAEVTNWREVGTWWQNVGQYLKRDATNQALYTDENFYSTKEVSAYGAGTGGGGGGGIIETVYGYGNLGQTFNNAILTDTFNAYTINQINTRLVSVENGSATTVNTTGTGNAITSLTKSGTVITANKDLTFSLSGHTHTISDITNLQTTLNSKLEASIFNTHNNDNIRHITGAERAKWDDAFNRGDFREFGLGNTPAKTLNELGAIDDDINTLPRGINAFIYPGDIATNVPGVPTDYPIGLRMSYNVNIGATLLFGRTENDKMWFRTDRNGVGNFKPWREVWHDGNLTSLSQLTDNIGVATHIANTSNPHSVTKAQVGLGNVDNTSDLLKPISTATQTALNLKANLASPTFTGTVTAPTFSGALTGLASLNLPLTGGTMSNTNLVINLNADLLDGLDGTSYSFVLSGYNSDALSTYSRTGVYGTSDSNPDKPPVPGGTVYNHIYSGRFGSQIFGGLSTNRWYARTSLNYTTGWGSWREFAFIDSNVASATKLQTPRTIWGQSFDGTGNVTGALSGATTIAASISVTSPKVIFNAAGWSMEQVGSELQLKYNNLIASRFLADGSIVGLGEITAYGATTGGEGVALLRTGGIMTGNLTMSADIIMNSGRAIGVSNLPLRLLGNALTYNASNVLTEANTATQIKMGNGWTIEQTTSALTIKKNGVVKGTFNA